MSWCRNIPPGALGLLADSCHNLRRVHAWGCSQVTQTLLCGHANDNLQFVGLEAMGAEVF